MLLSRPLEDATHCIITSEIPRFETFRDRLKSTPRGTMATGAGNTALDSLDIALPHRGWCSLSLAAARPGRDPKVTGTEGLMMKGFP